MRAAEKVAADELLRDGFEIIVEHDDMIAVPADAAADVQQDLWRIDEHRAELVGDGLGRVIVPGVEGIEHLARQRVSKIELVRSHRVALEPNAE